MAEIDDYIAPATNWATIDATANNLRSRLGAQNIPRLPIVEIVEQVFDYRLEAVTFCVEDRKTMGNAMGLTCPNGQYIMIRDDVYAKADSGDGRARFTFAHELGHFLLHTNAPLARATYGENIPPYRSAEKQANRFATALLMPLHLILASDTSEILAERFGVSKEAAGYRINELKKKSLI